MIRNLRSLSFVLAGVFFPAAFLTGQQVITTGTLLGEMVDLERLTKVPDASYRAVQYSSYDRRSVSRDEPHWFGNYDGFGREPVPGFEAVLKEPDTTGIGEYLLCDVRGTGAIVRLWTADMTGTIRLYLDNKLVYEGGANDFFWNFPGKTGGNNVPEWDAVFRQFDASYFPVPFAKSCRIEWVGDLQTRHFYHVQFKLYEKNTRVQTFRLSDPDTYRAQVERVAKTLASPEGHLQPGGQQVRDSRVLVKGARHEIFRIDGQRAIELLKIKLPGAVHEMAWRRLVLRVYFDGAQVPHIESPVGDFFGAAPGVNPYVSFPLSVNADSTMTCRFLMPFRRSVSVQLENMSDLPVAVDALVSHRSYEWNDSRSMYFRARWRADHDLVASSAGLMESNEGTEATDVPYLLAMGEGRVVGAACYLMNPTSVPTATGNWWGEGDEKIYVDGDTFPSFFGTGSEDYFNYSWCSDRIFYHPYCGQPRNDGPSNRGFVTNFRWHVSDDIYFKDKMAFYMELLPHGIVPGFSYARMVYAYGRPGMLDDHHTISPDAVRPLALPDWNPEGFRGSLQYRYLNAELVYDKKEHLRTGFEYGPLWAGGKTFLWYPAEKGEKIDFTIPTSAGKKNLILSLAHLPGGGAVRVLVNGQPVKLKGKETLDLNETGRVLHRAYTTGDIIFLEGRNTVTIESLSGAGSTVGVDMFWVRD